MWEGGNMEENNHSSKTLEYVLNKLDEFEKMLLRLEEKEKLLEGELEVLKKAFRDSESFHGEKHSELEGKIKTLEKMLGEIRVETKAISLELKKKADEEELSYIKAKMQLEG